MISFDEHVRSNQFNLTANLAIGYDFIVCGAGSSGSVVARRPIAFPCTAATSGRVAGGLCGGGLKAVAGSGAATKRWQPGNNLHFLDDARSVATANSGPFGSTSKLISKIRGGSGATGQSGLLSTDSNAISGINDIVTATAGLANNLGSSSYSLICAGITGCGSSSNGISSFNDLGSAAASVANSVDSINNGQCSGGATGFSSLNNSISGGGDVGKDLTISPPAPLTSR